MSALGRWLASWPPPRRGKRARSEPCEMDEALFKQRERTVDNIKRIYAVVYSISFTNILREIFDYAHHYLLGATQKGFASGLQLRLMMLVVFTTTVSVFAYQADKFLDLRYALRPAGDKAPMPHWRKVDFAVDAGSLILTMIPFTLMSYAFNHDLMERFGVIPFFFAYLLQLCTSLALLFLVRLKYLASLLWFLPPERERDARGRELLPEETRYGALTIHWYVLNSAAILLLLLLLDVSGGAGRLCGSALHGPLAWFATLFTLLAVVRNIVDYRAVWPFLYMNKRDLVSDELTWLMRHVTRARLERGFARYDWTAIGCAAGLWLGCAAAAHALNPGVCPAPARPAAAVQG